MSTIPRPIPDPDVRPNTAESTVNAVFLKYLPAVTTHAAIQFRHLPRTEREDAIAEAAAAAFINVHAAVHSSKDGQLTPSSVARYAELHVRNGKHVGSGRDRSNDVLSTRAQHHGGFRVHRLDSRGWPLYDAMNAPDQHVWRDHLLYDRRTPPSDQAAFRLDWNGFLAQQSDRTRTALAMLAAGHQQTEVADLLGVTPSAVCQRVKRAEREWNRLQGGLAATGQRDDAPQSAT